MPLIYLLILFCCSNLQASTQAYVDRAKIIMGQTTQLTIISNNSLVSQPNLSQIKRNFNVIGSMIATLPKLKNGKRTYSGSWRYILTPKRSGTLTIDPLSLSAQKTPVITIQVRPRPKAKPTKKSKIIEQKSRYDILVSATINKSKLYPNELLKYSLSVSFATGSQQPPTLIAPFVPGAIIIALQQPVIEKLRLTKKNRTVYKQDFAIFTEKTAIHQIKPAKVTFPAQGNGKDFSLNSNTLHYEIIPQANQTSLGYWLPSNNLSIEETWDIPKTLNLDSVIKRTIKVQAQGLNVDSLPLMSTLSHANMRIKLENIETQNHLKKGILTAVRTESVSMRFNRIGTFSIVPIDIHWWNTDLNQARVSTLAAHTFIVLDEDPAKKSAAITIQSPPVEQQQPLTTKIKAASSHETDDNPLSSPKYNWIIAILLALLVISTAGWLSSHRKKRPKY